MSGVLEIRVSGSANWTSINPINGPIPPIADGTIRRVNANDTLNFLTPGAFSTGTLEYRAHVFDSAHPNQPGYTSGHSQGILRFMSVGPLRVRGFGVHNNGKDAMEIMRIFKQFGFFSGLSD